MIKKAGLTLGVPPPGSRHERVSAKFWRSDSDSPPGNPDFQGTGTGSTRYPGTRYPDNMWSRSRLSSEPDKGMIRRTSFAFGGENYKRQMVPVSAF